MNYLSEFFVPYDYFLETNVLLRSKSCILNSFLFLQEVLLLIFLSSKFLLFLFILYSAENKLETIFIVIWVSNLDR